VPDTKFAPMTLYNAATEPIDRGHATNFLNACCIPILLPDRLAENHDCSLSLVQHDPMVTAKCLLLQDCRRSTDGKYLGIDAQRLGL